MYRACGYDLDKDRDILGMLYVIEAEFGQLVQSVEELTSAEPRNMDLVIDLERQMEKDKRER